MINKCSSLYLCIVLLLIMILSAEQVVAVTMTSSNFRVDAATLSSDGTDNATSSSFLHNSILGESIVGANSTSSSFQSDSEFREVLQSTTTELAPTAAVAGWGTFFFRPNAAPVSACTGADFNGDGIVDITDFGTIIFFWQESNPSNSCVDFNADGIVDLIDFGAFIFAWNT